MAIPVFREDGFLPEGVHFAEMEEVRERFGLATPRRRELMERVENWIELARLVRARRLLLDGSFVTEKLSPNDVDAVMLLPLDFDERLREFDSVAWEIRDCAHYGHPAELFLAKGDDRWLEWIEYFSRVRMNQDIHKGLIEVRL